MPDCTLKTVGKTTLECSTCGRIVELTKPTPPNKVHVTCGPREPIYFGDRVARWLSRAGITPARIIACKKACGLKPKCGCGKRKSWLNQLDKRVRRLFG